MSSASGRSTATVALVIVGGLLALWVIRFVIGLFVGLAQLALVAGLGLVGAYAVYRLWNGWSDAASDARLGPRQ